MHRCAELRKWSTTRLKITRDVFTLLVDESTYLKNCIMTVVHSTVNRHGKSERKR